MTAKQPPVPPANQSHKGPGDDRRNATEAAVPGKKRNTDPDHRGQQANIKQNTTNQGHQQDR